MMAMQHDKYSPALESWLQKYGQVEIKVINHFYFIQIISDTPPTNDEVIKKFREIEGVEVTIWHLSIYSNEQDSFRRRARLGTVADGYGPSGIYTSTLAGGDAFILMREIDVSYLEYAANILGVEPLEVPFIQETHGSFGHFKVTAGAKYANVEVAGHTHEVTSIVAQYANGIFKVSITPTGFRNF